MSTPAPPALPPEVYCTFSDQINQASIQRIFNAFAAASGRGVQRAHFLFQSNGGRTASTCAGYSIIGSESADGAQLRKLRHSYLDSVRQSAERLARVAPGAQRDEQQRQFARSSASQVTGPAPVDAPFAVGVPCM
jgi:hypothetical protein